jgi:protein SCO1
MSDRITCAGALLAAVASVVVPRASSAQTRQPAVARAVSVEEHLLARVPLDLSFVDPQGVRVRLRDYARGDRPVLLVLAYARCKMLCSLVLRGLSDSVARLETLEPGRDFDLVLVSIDSNEEPHEAVEKQAALLERIGHPGDASRWAYLRGDDSTIRALADALGFRYAWDPRTEQYAHPSVAFVLTSDGRIASYVYGIEGGRADLAGPLEAAADGRSTASESEELLRCFRFDPGARKYAAQIASYFRIGGAVLFVAVGSLVASLVVWERRRRG